MYEKNIPKYVLLNPIYYHFPEHNMQYIDEPYLNIFHEIKWRKTLVPKKIYIYNKNEISNIDFYKKKVKFKNI
tara:strand:+ start:853 stop:1071 length:219 start_codon:yes stop_codon:yes gene_type:complete